MIYVHRSLIILQSMFIFNWHNLSLLRVVRSKILECSFTIWENIHANVRGCNNTGYFLLPFCALVSGNVCEDDDTRDVAVVCASSKETMREFPVIFWEHDSPKRLPVDKFDLAWVVSMRMNHVIECLLII